MEKFIKLVNLSVGSEAKAVIAFILTTALIGIFVNILTTIVFKFMLKW